MRKRKIKLDSSVFRIATISILILGLILVAYVFGSSQGYSKGQKAGIEKGKEIGKIELLEDQRKAAEAAIKAAQKRLQNERKASPEVKNDLEETFTKPFGAPITKPFRN